MDREYVKAFKRLFADNGITDYHFETGGKHPKVVASLGDRHLRVPFPSSASDARRGVANAIAHARRELGLRPIPRQPRSSPPRNRCAVRQSRSPLMSSNMKLAELPSGSWQEVLARMSATFTDTLV